MPGVPSSPADGPRPVEGESIDEVDQHDGRDPDGDVDRSDADPDEVARRATLPRRLWTSVVFVAIQTWFVLGVLLLVLGGVGAPVPPAVTDHRSVVPWVPRDVWSVVADAGWIVVVSAVVAGLLRRRLAGRGMWPLPATADVTVLVGVAVVVAMAVWPAVFPDVSPGATAVGAMLLTIVLLRLREVFVGRDLLGPLGRLRGTVALLVPLALVAAYAAWHPLLVRTVEIRTSASASVSGGDGSSTGEYDDPQQTSTEGQAVRITTGARRTVRLTVDIQGVTGGVRLQEATPVVPGGAFRLLPPPRPNPDGSPVDGSPLPHRLGHGDSIDREYRLRAVGACDRREQRIDRLRVRYRRLGRAITTELPLDAAVTLSCRGDGTVRP